MEGPLDIHYVPNSVNAKTYCLGLVRFQKCEIRSVNIKSVAENMN